MFPSHIIALVALGELFHQCEAARAVLSNIAYEQFRLVHRSDNSDSDPVLYHERHALFQARTAEVAAHNAAGKSWTMVVNRFADFTASELRSVLGYKRNSGRWTGAPAGASSFLQAGHSEEEVVHIDIASLEKTVDWTTKMNSSNVVHNQGGCGSCWAHAAVAAMEAHAELATGLKTQLSTQQIIDCTANPSHCGGTGGCHGATAELAFEHARNHGISADSQYQGTPGKCSQSSPVALTIQTFVRLPENKASYLTYALAKKGPVAMSIAADGLFMYNAGVFAGCMPDTIVNHAVLGMGYGTDPESGKDYWLIKNSWGSSWGEEGYFRVERFNKDDAHCGTDTKPQDGVFCEKHPDTVRVCGMCGVTSDSAYPVIAPSAAAQLKATSSKIETVHQHFLGAETSFPQ